jgi:hypothetical protein
MTCQRISNADIGSISRYDPAAERRAATLDRSWDSYLDEASLILLEDLEHGWFPKYVGRQTAGVPQYVDVNGLLLSNFNPVLLRRDNISLIRLHCFKAIEVFYSTLVTDVSNVNEVDNRNYEYSVKRFQDEWTRALQLNHFYDVNLDGVIDVNEQGFTSSGAFVNADRRYM